MHGDRSSPRTVWNASEVAWSTVSFLNLALCPGVAGAHNFDWQDLIESLSVVGIML
jgi:hypothetical protein